MGWKKRGATHYYYRSVRVAGRVRSEYEGHGPITELLAECIEHKRAVRQKLRAADLEDREAFLAEEQELGFDDYCRKVENLARATLVAAGYHCHKRSEWRKRRVPRSTNVPVTTLATVQQTAPAEEIKNRRAFAEFVSLPNDEYTRRLEQAKSGDPASLEWMGRAFVADPTGELAAIYGTNAASQIERILIFRVAGEDPVAETALLAQVERMRKELAGPDPSALERVLVDRVALSWLSLHTLELQYEREKHNLGPAMVDAMERRIARTNRQFNEACKTLAVVRRLAVPTLQVMVAERQINVLGGSGGHKRIPKAAAGGGSA